MYNEAIIAFFKSKVNRGHKKFRKLTIKQGSEVRGK